MAGKTIQIGKVKRAGGQIVKGQVEEVLGEVSGAKVSAGYLNELLRRGELAIVEKGKAPKDGE